ncbi:MAG TPA: amidohydrolase family protein [Actinophytocola sp.]|uniref:amidohydrolase n=1 Tax=Actinophytocola sp. TaxID=1872138 RepID=UPI002DDD6E86|nr:amidohydrolase family protein [Actinophytocola sp.]HEV2780281.1 amidohydrolase family protein [Actinophytocola sp.]
MTSTLLRGGRIHGPSRPHATALLVRDGVVEWVGHDPDRPADEIVDLDGALVTPAFVDAHVHSTSAGLLRTGLDLTGCRSMAELLARVRDRSAPGALVWGHGWDETAWPEGRPPTRAELDEASGGAAVYLSRIDVHSALVSTALVTPRARTAAGWSDGDPVSRAAHHVVRKAFLDSITPAQRRAAQREFLRHAASMGVTAVHECAGPDISGADDFADLLALSAEPLPEVIGYWGERNTVLPDGARGLAGDLFVDGALGSRTAALGTAYADRPDTAGALYLDAEQIAEHVVACTLAGIQAGFHVIGDAAVAAVVAGFARAERIVGVPALRGSRHRLEHLEMVTAEQAALLGRWGVIGSVQPLFDAAWGGRDGMYARRLGPDRGSALNPFAHLEKAGVVLAFGSDCPVTPVDPWAAVRAAVHHRTDGFGLAPWSAFAAHTRGGWYAAGVDGAGELVPGAPATYAVWDCAGFPSLEPGAPLPVCLRTVRDGRIIYERGSA